MLQQRWIWVVVLVGCGNVGPATSPDGARAPDATRTPDATPVCDPSTPFGAPQILAGFDTASQEVDARLSPDELTIYLSIRTGTAQDLYVATRSSTSDAFGAPTALTTVNSTASDYAPSVSPDGLTLLFQSDRVPNEGSHIYIATRSSTFGDFGTPTLALGLNSATTTDTDGQPYFTPDDGEVWFESNRSGGAGAGDIYRSTVSSAGFGAPTHVAELASTADDWVPALSADRLTIYFGSNRTDGGALGDFDIWTAHRTSVTDGFGAPTDVTELNSTATDNPTWLSLDNCRLYMESTRGGTYDLYVATRTP